MKFRGTIVFARLGAGLSLVALVSLALAGPVGAADLIDLQRRAQQVADEVTGLEKKLHRLESRQEALKERIERSSGDLAELDLELHAHEAAAASAEDVFVARAIETYKSGTSTQVELLLSAETLSDVYDITEAHARLAIADSTNLEELEQARDAALEAQTHIDGTKQALLADQERAETLRERVASSLKDRRAVLASLEQEISLLEEQAREAAAQVAATTGVTASQALLDVLSGSGPAPGIPDGFASTGVSFEGLASWYGPGFEGNPTANGDIFDPDLFTAASKELPLGSWLYVEHEGRGVVVYVNDRGPYVGERILDLSRAAAAAIGMESAGVGWVRAEILIKT